MCNHYDNTVSFVESIKIWHLHKVDIPLRPAEILCLKSNCESISISFLTRDKTLIQYELIIYFCIIGKGQKKIIDFWPIITNSNYPGIWTNVCVLWFSEETQVSDNQSFFETWLGDSLSIKPILHCIHNGQINTTEKLVSNY